MQKIKKCEMRMARYDPTFLIPEGMTLRYVHRVMKKEIDNWLKHVLVVGFMFTDIGTKH